MLSTPTSRIDLADAGRFGFPSLRHSHAAAYTPRYFLTDEFIPSQYGHTLPTAAKDLLDIAGSLMWVDRKYRRSRRRGRYGMWRGWVRSFDVTLGVRNVDLWQQHAVKAALENLLFWLTEDQWNLEFVPQKGVRRLSDIQDNLFPSPPKNPLIALYSGGLDSLAGVAQLIRLHPTNTIVLVSAVHDRQRLRGVIETQVAGLRNIFGHDRLLYAPLPFHVVNPPHKGKEAASQEEHTQRTRGFLFLAFGAAVASALDGSQIFVNENGVGSLNLPMDWYQLGTQNTRATHPRTILEMGRLLGLIGIPQLRYSASTFLQTKGELCRELQSPDLQRLARLTVSCDGFPQRISTDLTNAQLHCGWCTSCLLRRQAIYAGGIGEIESPSYYRRDLCLPTADLRPSYFEHLKEMLDQCHLIERAVSSHAATQSLTNTFPEIMEASRVMSESPETFGLASEQDTLGVLIDLLRRYAKEWSAFPYRLSTS